MAENKELIKYLENFEERLKSFVKEEVAVVKKELKEEVAGVKEEVAGVKEEVAGVKEEVAGVKEDLKKEFARYTGILMEDAQHKFEILAEGIQTIDEKLSREKEEHQQEHKGIERRLLVHEADISKLNRKVGLG